MNRGTAGAYILVTGAGGGLGRALVTALANIPVPVAAFSRTPAPPHHPGQSSEVVSLLWQAAGDLGDFSLMDRNLSVLLETWGPPQIVVHNASVLHHRNSLWTEEETSVRDTFRINLETPLFWVSRLVPSMIQAGGGGHVFLSSSVGREPRKNWGSYAISKAGIETLSSNLALELPPPLFSLTLNPGPVMTRMREKAYPGKDPARPRSPGEAARIFARFLLHLREEGVGRTYNGRMMDLDTLVLEGGYA